MLVEYLRGIFLGIYYIVRGGQNWLLKVWKFKDEFRYRLLMVTADRFYLLFILEKNLSSSIVFFGLIPTLHYNSDWKKIIILILYDRNLDQLFYLVENSKISCNLVDKKTIGLVLPHKKISTNNIFFLNQTRKIYILVYSFLKRKQVWKCTCEFKWWEGVQSLRSSTLIMHHV